MKTILAFLLFIIFFISQTHHSKINDKTIEENDLEMFNNFMNDNLLNENDNQDQDKDTDDAFSQDLENFFNKDKSKEMILVSARKN